VISQHFTEIDAITFLATEDPKGDIVAQIRRQAGEITAKVHAVIGSRVPPERQCWSALEAAQVLMTAMGRLLLPDVSHLPVAAIVEMRSDIGDTLGPMRAEMLHLTEVLRTFVEDDQQDRAKLQAEANNLIATRVLPVVLEADRHAKELLDKKWRAVYGKLASALGFLGAAYLDPNLLAKAVKQGIEAVVKMGENVEDTTPGTAQFVLHARRLVQRAQT
jgi:hypothetical protein